MGDLGNFEQATLSAIDSIVDKQGFHTQVMNKVRCVRQHKGCGA